MDRQKNSRPCTLYPRMNHPRNDCRAPAGACIAPHECGVPHDCGVPYECGKGESVFPSGCGFESPYGCRFPSLAMVYNAPQAWEKLYSPEKALQRGTASFVLTCPLQEERGASNDRS